MTAPPEKGFLSRDYGNTKRLRSVQKSVLTVRPPSLVGMAGVSRIFVHIGIASTVYADIGDPGFAAEAAGQLRRAKSRRQSRSRGRVNQTSRSPEFQHRLRLDLQTQAFPTFADSYSSATSISRGSRRSNERPSRTSEPK